jgi:hypothetical protein
MEKNGSNFSREWLSQLRRIQILFSMKGEVVKESSRYFSIIGGTTYGNWQNGTTNAHQSIGWTTYHNFSDGRQWTSTRVGSTTYTNCN